MPRFTLIPVLLAGFAFAGCGDRAGPAAMAVGAPFPELRLAALVGPQKDAVLLPRGHDVVLNVWATWCEPCRREMASLEALARSGAGVEVVGLSVDQDANLAREFLLREGVTFANFSDPGGRAVFDALRVDVLPQTFVIAGDGALAARIVGPRDWAGEDSRALLRERLGQGAK